MKEREEVRAARREAARENFIRKVDALCGLLEVQDAAKQLSLPNGESQVKDMVANGELIAIKGGDRLRIPGFQVAHGKVIPHLKDVIACLGDVSAEASCTFFLNEIEVPSGEKGLLSDILSRDPTDADLAIIKREAVNFLTPTAS